MTYTEFSNGVVIPKEKFAENCCSLLDTKVSGVPILQNGKLIGAVTHVFVQDATKGYGIFIEEMMGN